MQNSSILAVGVLAALMLAGPSHAGDWINVKNFNAVGDSVTDDTAAIVAAMATANANGAVLYFPPGRYKMTQRLTLPNAPITVLGDGSGISTIEWTNASGGILYQPAILSDPAGAGVDRELTIKGLTLRTTQNGGGAAIEAIWPENPGQAAETANISDVQIRGQSFVQYWNTGIKLVGARNSRIENTNIYGSTATPTGLDKGIHIHSNGSSTDYRISDVEISGVNTGIHVDGGVAGQGSGPEGVLVHQATITSANFGIHVVTADPEPMLNVRGSHMAVRMSGIRTNAIASVLNENTIYLFPSSGTPAVGIYTDNAYDLTIRDNWLSSSVPQSANGIVISNSQRLSISGNNFMSMTSCIWLQSSASSNFVAQNVFSNCAFKVLDQGSNNTVFGWGSQIP